MEEATPAGWSRRYCTRSWRSTSTVVDKRPLLRTVLDVEIHFHVDEISVPKHLRLGLARRCTPDSNRAAASAWPRQQGSPRCRPPSRTWCPSLRFHPARRNTALICRYPNSCAVSFSRRNDTDGTILLRPRESRPASNQPLESWVTSSADGTSTADAQPAAATIAAAQSEMQGAIHRHMVTLVVPSLRPEHSSPPCPVHLPRQLTVITVRGPIPAAVGG